MARLIMAAEPVAARRRIYFHIVDTNGIQPANGEDGGQPEISIDGSSWTPTGISALTLIGNGRYHATLDQAAVATSGAWIETRYKSAGTAEIPGDSVQVIGYDPTSDPSTVVGTGSVLVDHDYGGPDNLSYQTDEGVGIDGASIAIYLKSDWDAGSTGQNFVVVRSFTTVGGKWGRAVMLDPETYVILFERQPDYGPDTVELTVV